MRRASPTPHVYTEDQLVEQPGIGLFAEIGWQTVSALEETVGATDTLLRETKGEVVLVSRFRGALERLSAGHTGSPALPPEAITAAVDELTRDRSAIPPLLPPGEGSGAGLPSTSGKGAGASSDAGRAGQGCAETVGEDMYH